MVTRPDRACVCGSSGVPYCEKDNVERERGWGRGKGGRPQWVRVRQDARERWTIVSKSTHYASQSVLQLHAIKCCVCSARGTVWRLHQPLTKESNYKGAHHSCHPVDDHHDVEDDDQEVEDGHHIQPVLGSTDHATDCPALLVAWSDFPVASWSVLRSFVSLELLPLALSDLKIGVEWLGWCPASGASCFTSRNFRNAARKSARDRNGPTGSGLFKTYRPHHFRIVLVVAEWQGVWVVFFCEFV